MTGGGFATARPPERETLATLRDGTRVRIRSTGPGDRPAVVDFLSRVSAGSLELRFFTTVPVEVATAEILNTGVPRDAISLLMEVVDRGPPRIVGHAECVRTRRDAPVAEAAFLVADEVQGRGAGTILLWELAKDARASGIRTLEAFVLPENRAMLDVFADAGFPHTITYREREIFVRLDIARDPETVLCRIVP